jgi:hypothetical protein
MRTWSHRWSLVARRLARMVRTRWRPIFLVTGGLLIVMSIVLPITVAFVPGMLVVGLAVPDGRPNGYPAAMVRMWAWLHEGQPNHP